MRKLKESTFSNAQQVINSNVKSQRCGIYFLILFQAPDVLYDRVSSMSHVQKVPQDNKHIPAGETHTKAHASAPAQKEKKEGGKASFSPIDLGKQSAQSGFKKCKEHLSRLLLCRTRLSATSPSLSFSPSAKPLLPLRSVSIHIRHGSIEGKQRLFFLFDGLKQCA